jgi:hypothetical protein
MLALLFLLAQPAQPDVQLDVRANVRRVRIERSGEASLEVRAEPDAGSVVDVAAPEARGRRTLRNVEVRVRAEARIAAPQQNPQDAETDRPERR